MTLQGAQDDRIWASENEFNQMVASVCANSLFNEDGSITKPSSRTATVESFRVYSWDSIGKWDEPGDFNDSQKSGGERISIYSDAAAPKENPSPSGDDMVEKMMSTGIHPSKEDLRRLRILRFEGYLESSPQTNNRFSPPDNEPTEIDSDHITTDDVLCGQEHRSSTHPGNVEFRRIIQENRAKYISFRNSHGEKTKLSKSILNNEIKGRLVRTDDNGRHYLLTEAKARDKVGRALCEKRKRKRVTRNEDDTVIQVEMRRSAGKARRM